MSMDFSILQGSLIDDYPDIDMSHVVITHDVSHVIHHDNQPLTETVLMSKDFYNEQIRRCREIVRIFAHKDPGWPHSEERYFRDVRFALSWITGEDVTNPRKHDHFYIYRLVKDLYPSICAGVFKTS